MNASAPGNAERHRPLAARFVAGPYVSAPDKAEQRLGDWLSGLEPAQSAQLDALLDHDAAKKILLGIAEFSPYLFDLVRADAARLIRILQCDPESHLAALIESTSAAVWSAAVVSAPAGARASPASDRAAAVPSIIDLVVIVFLL